MIFPVKLISEVQPYDMVRICTFGSRNVDPYQSPIASAFDRFLCRFHGDLAIYFDPR